VDGKNFEVSIFGNEVGNLVPMELLPNGLFPLAFLTELGKCFKKGCQVHDSHFGRYLRFLCFALPQPCMLGRICRGSAFVQQSLGLMPSRSCSWRKEYYKMAGFEPDTTALTPLVCKIETGSREWGVFAQFRFESSLAKKTLCRSPPFQPL
jgi:hypothetical protein